MCWLPDDTPVDLHLLELIASRNQSLAIVHHADGTGHDVRGCVRVIDLITYMSVRTSQSQERSSVTLADVPMLEPLVISEDCSVLTAMRCHREWLLQEPDNSREHFQNIALRGRRDKKPIFYGKGDLVLVSASADTLRNAIRTGQHNPTEILTTGILTLNDIMLSSEPKRFRSAMRAQSKARRYTFFPSDESARASIAEPKSDSDDEISAMDGLFHQKLEGLQESLNSLGSSNNPIQLQSEKSGNSKQILEMETSPVAKP
jgi:hypothetical protein